MGWQRARMRRACVAIATPTWERAQLKRSQLAERSDLAEKASVQVRRVPVGEAVIPGTSSITCCDWSGLSSKDTSRGRRLPWHLTNSAMLLTDSMATRATKTHDANLMKPVPASTNDFSHNMIRSTSRGTPLATAKANTDQSWLGTGRFGLK